MPPETIVENEFATLLYYPGSKIIHHQFHKPTFGKTFRTVLMQGLKILKQHHARKWLSDDRKNSALGSENTDWSQTVWGPQARAAGWNCWAIVLPRELVGQMNMRQFIEINLEKGVSDCVFPEPTQALTWLEQQS